MKKITLVLLVAIISISFLALQSCQKDSGNNNYLGLQTPELPATLYEYADFEIPVHFNQFGIPIDPAQFNITNAGATLGRVLFYDKKISLSNEISCGSCHFQNKAFSDTKALSEGVINNHTPRNSQAIINPINEQSYFWDSRVFDLEEMVLMPIQNHNEQGMEDLTHLTKKLAKVDYYPTLFEEAFGATDITEEKIASALTQFLRSMFSANSKFDEAQIELITNNTDNVLSEKEKAGRTLFTNSGCNGCHGGPDLRGSWGDDWANIGLEMEYTDKGLGAEALVPIFGTNTEGMFKVPSLRNIVLTAPYMHDGRFQSLKDVINHYSEGVQPHPALDWRLIDGSDPAGATPRRLNLNDSEIDDLIAFLQTFTDHTLISDPRFADPFK